MKKALAVILLALLAGTYSFAQNRPDRGSRGYGVFVAENYNYGADTRIPPMRVAVGLTGTGSQTYTLSSPSITLPDGRVVYPLAVPSGTAFPPITIDVGANSETVTPTATSSGCSFQGGTCTVTASFSNAHGQGAPVFSGSFGLQEALNDAFQLGGGTVVIDQDWVANGGVNSTITAAIPYQQVGIMDVRGPFPQAWQATQNVATILAAPATLTSSTVGDGLAGTGANTTGGKYTNSNPYYTCIAYVDVMGNEGPCSATYNFTPAAGTTNQIGFKTPAASTGAVGYTIYISLTNGTYNLTYQVPITSTICTLTTIETITPACAVKNTTYNQTGSTAVVSNLTVSTAPLHLLKTTASVAAGAYIGTPSGRTVYAYAPTGSISTNGLTSNQQAYAISVAPATTVPEVIATIPIPIGSMNYPGASLCISGQATEASNGSTATVQNIQFWWDAAGSDTAGTPVLIGQLQLTATLVTANADFWEYHDCFQTTVSGSGVTAGSIQPYDGHLVSTYGAGVLGNAGTEINVAALSSLNLSGSGGNTQRIHVVWLHTTGTDANGVTNLALRAWYQ